LRRSIPLGERDLAGWIVVFWLQAGRVDLEEFEGAASEWGLFGELVEADLVAARRMRLRVRVAGAPGRSRKLETVSPSSVRLLAALSVARWERRAGAMGSADASGASSTNRSSASRFSISKRTG
jgi:hypothetical protein